MKGTITRIDTHSHIVPSFYREWLMEMNLEPGGYPIPEWHRERAIEFMDIHAISASILSVSAPGVAIAKPSKAATMARKLNEYTAEIAQANPKRFGYFATVWQSDIDAVLKEVEYVFDKMNADGIVLPTNSGRSYPGGPEFEPLLEELNYRNATVFLHPTDLANSVKCEIPPYVADFLLDSVRAALNICHTGALDRYPSIKWILAHGGGFLPYAALRLSTYASPRGNAREGIERLKSFYLDTALATSDYSLPSLRAFARPDRILYGSDYPYAPLRGIENYAATLDRTIYDPEELQCLNSKNAMKVFPALAERMGNSLR